VNGPRERRDQWIERTFVAAKKATDNPGGVGATAAALVHDRQGRGRTRIDISGAWSSRDTVRELGRQTVLDGGGRLAVFRIVFSPWISPADADQYIAGAIILAARPLHRDGVCLELAVRR
jgi:hypothetical protein